MFYILAMIWVGFTWVGIHALYYAVENRKAALWRAEYFKRMGFKQTEYAVHIDELHLN